MRPLMVVAIMLMPAILQAQVDSAAPRLRPPACDSTDYRKFDFWLGAWEVRTPDGRFLGTDSVSKILRGCVVYERWHGASGGFGESWNTFDRRARTWRTVWVNDAGVVILARESTGRGAMNLEVQTSSSPPMEESHIERWVWHHYPSPDSIRVVFEASTDRGRSWKNLYDGRYRRMR